MRLRCFVAGLAVLLATAGTAQPVSAQSNPAAVDLVVSAGRPLRVALDERIRLKHVGQPVTGIVTEPVYAYDRVVIPAGTRVRGHIVRIDSGSTFVRARAYLGGNLSPAKHAVLRFDTLQLADGREMPIDTIVKGGIPHVTRRVAADSTPRVATDRDASTENDAAAPRLMSRARREAGSRLNGAVYDAKEKVRNAFASIKSLAAPGTMRRLKDFAVQQLPYHPQYLASGTVYDAELSSPVSFGRAIPTIGAPPGTAPAPESVLTARLATTLDSSKTPRGTPFEAVITETVFSADHRVILPEGTKLTGEVTLARPARRFHRNGQLRFLFERVQPPNQPSAPLTGALHAIDASAADRVALDDEGGTTIGNSRTRFIVPALALLSLRGSMDGDGRHVADPDGDGTIKTRSGGGRGVLGGFIGMQVIGAAAGQIARPVGIALSVYGAARAIYRNVLGKGRDVVFTADTPIQVRLAPGPAGR